MIFRNKTNKWWSLLILGAFVLISLTPSIASALSADQKRVFDSGIYYFDTEASVISGYCGVVSGLGGTPTGGGTVISQSQINIAKTIMGIAKTNKLGKDAALIGLMVGLDESSLTILANSTVPVSLENPAKQGVGSNYDSVGVFQQRPSTGWSTIATGPEADSNQAAVWQLMNPAYSAEAFFGSPPGSNAAPALSKGLQNKDGWQSMQPWVAAQAVQISGTADGSNYKRFVSQAQSLVEKYWDESTAIPLPVPFSGGIVSDGGQSAGGCFNSDSASSGSCTVSQPVAGSVNGSGGEYSQEQLASIFGDPGTAADHSGMESSQVSVNFLGHSVKVNKLVAPCLSAVAQEIGSSGSGYTINTMACYRFDSDNGTSNIGLKSYHTYGAACDINAATNPFVESGADTPHDMPQEYVQAFHDHGFTWGGNWSQPKDYMHFEFNGINPNGS